MKVRIKKSVLVEVEKAKINEIWDKQLSRWDELNVADMDVQGKFANLVTTDGDVYLSVPVESFEVVPWVQQCLRHLQRFFSHTPIAGKRNIMRAGTPMQNIPPSTQDNIITRVLFQTVFVKMSLFCLWHIFYMFPNYTCIHRKFLCHILCNEISMFESNGLVCSYRIDIRFSYNYYTLLGSVVKSFSSFSDDFSMLDSSSAASGLVSVAMESFSSSTFFRR